MSTDEQPIGEGNVSARRSAPDAIDASESAQLPELASPQPLLDEDPAKVDEFWLDARLAFAAGGTAYVAHENGGDALLLLLLSQGAAADAAARARFAGEINALHIDTVVARGGQGQDEGQLAVRYREPKALPTSADQIPQAPWAALAFDGTAAAVLEATRILDAVDLGTASPISEPAGPEFKLHWIEQTSPGTTRNWPLSWPGRTDRAGWITMLVSFLLMAIITALALLLAILVFQNQPLVNAPQPIPSPASGSGSGSGSPMSPSGSGSSSGSPSGSTSGEPAPYSHSPSMNQPSGDNSGDGDPSPNRRL